MAENGGIKSTTEHARAEYPAWLQYGGAVLGVGVAFLARWLADPVMGEHYPFVFFLTSVLWAAWLGGLGPALFALALGFLLGDWFFAEPRHALGLYRPWEIIPAVIYFIVGLSIAAFGHAVRVRQRKLIAEQHAQTKLAETLRQQMQLLEKAHEALRRSEEQMRLVIDLVPHGIFAKDAQGRFLFVNRALAELNAKTPQQMVGHTDLELAKDKAEAEKFRQDDLAVLESGAPKIIREELLTDAEGKTRTLQTTKVPFTVPATGERAVLGVAVDISERKRAEEALQNIALFPEQNPEPVLRVQRDGTLLFANRASARLRETWKCSVGQPVPEAVQRLVAETLATGAVYETRLTFDSTTYQFTMAPVAAHHYVNLYGHDVTQALRAEIALRESEEQFRGIFETANEGIWMLDADAHVTLVNPRMAEMLGYAANEMIGKRKLDFVAEKDHSHVMKHWVRRQKGVSEQYELRFRHRDGHEVWTLMAARAIMRNSQFSGALDMITDITEQKLAEAALRESEERFRTMANASPALIWMSDTTKDCIWFNKAWLDFVGRPMEKEIGNGWADNVHPDDFKHCLEVYTTSFDARKDFEMEYRMRRHDGEYRWLLDRGTPLRDANGEFRGYIGSCVDVTENRLKREELERIVEDRTARLREAVGELEAFSYSIAHDMRAPLRAMQGFSGILAADYTDKLDAEGQEYLRRISRSAERLDRLIQDVLNYSKVVREELPLGPVDVARLIQGIIESYPNLQSPNANIRIEGKLPEAVANEAALTQVVSNLLGNAVKFVATGRHPEVRVRAETENGFVRFWFEDNGIGISKEGQSRLFRMFQRVSNSDQYEGTGIGLAIVRKAVERMGGTLGVESEENKGSRFWVQLRRADS